MIRPIQHNAFLITADHGGRSADQPSTRRATAEAGCPLTPNTIPAKLTREPGFGEFHISRFADRMRVTRLFSHNPLRLLVPRTSDTVARVYATTFGGGLVQGDHIRLHGVIGPAASCIFTTQSSTRVYPCPQGSTSRQNIDIDIGGSAVLEVLADPLVCFHDARIAQRQVFNLADDASLLLVDTFTSGRWSNGERWAFARLENRIDIHIAGRPWLADRMLLCGTDTSNPLAAQFGVWNCISTVVFAGPRYAAQGKELHERISLAPPGPTNGLIYAMWPHHNGPDGPAGHILRAAGESTRIVTAFLEESVGPLCLSGSLFHRKW